MTRRGPCAGGTGSRRGSSTQWRRFSIAQWPRMASCPGARLRVAAKAAAGGIGAVPARRSWLRREVCPSIAARCASAGQLPAPIRERRREPRRVDPPPLAWRALGTGQIPPREAERRRAPGRDVLRVVAVGDRAAGHQKQRFRQGARDPPDVARVLARGEALLERGKPGFSGRSIGGRGQDGVPDSHRRVARTFPWLSPAI